ncbi:hypothetical protein QWY14_12010 [Planococcus sp. N028]|uniref:SMI1/KNR4 family protein n=1 Tax=Planococcus shixiaomingii TaxID=3058393 RepID=A0ABT8N3R8_9BACL|nr:hypothetical protein [Planococcus sp. N028]MDN7242530.1 hypothetical protein [Planococcus sp. N028]
MAKLNYGKYEIPERLKQIIELQQHLNEVDQLKYGDLLGYYFSDEGISARYLNTPLDVIPFARPGVDGIHFGFLTDFGQVKDLYDAYIVRVSPMDFDNPVHVVARNIEDFISTICFYPDSMEILDMTSLRKEVLEFLCHNPMIPKETMLTNQEYNIHRIVCEKFQLKPIGNFENYFYLLHQQRGLDAILPTLDHIGVVKKEEATKASLNNIILLNLKNKDEITLPEVKSFFETAVYEAKLVFLRDGYSKGLLWDQEDIKLFLSEHLLLMDLPDEAESIFYP